MLSYGNTTGFDVKLYLAGLFASNFDLSGRVYAKLDPREQEMRRGCQWLLESYHYIHREKAVERIRREGAKVFLDSGAFSAFTQGISVDIGKYCDYVLRNSDIIEHVDGQPLASVLDAIGDCDGTWQNQMEMERRGVRPLPCYHYGEPTEVLDWYIANYTYITIGGMVPISTPQLKLWLDRLWRDHLTHPDGTPKVKVHGFGLTSLPLMMRYPWYSVDSSTWVQWAANGMVLVPGLVGQVDVSNRSSRRKIKGQHMDSVAPVQTSAIEAAISGYGVDPDRLRDLYYSRWAFNAWAFPYYAKDKAWEGERFVPETDGLF
jgi:hypothetical protein